LFLFFGTLNTKSGPGNGFDPGFGNLSAAGFTHAETTGSDFCQSRIYLLDFLFFPVIELCKHPGHFFFGRRFFKFHFRFLEFLPGSVCAAALFKDLFAPFDQPAADFRYLHEGYPPEKSKNFQYMPACFCFLPGMFLFK
jgi:hypothetical protein